MAGATGNTLRLIGAVAASFFLPLGYLAMSLLGFRRMPGLATICAALSLVGWIPWAALIVLDDLAITIDQTGNTPQLTALWTRLNDDPYMTAFLLIYVIGHLLSAVLIGYMLGRLRIIPVWAAWAFALSSLATILIFPIHNDVFQQTLKYLVCALLFAGAIPAAWAMLKGLDQRARQSCLTATHLRFGARCRCGPRPAPASRLRGRRDYLARPPPRAHAAHGLNARPSRRRQCSSG